MKGNIRKTRRPTTFHGTDADSPALVSGWGRERHNHYGTMNDLQLSNSNPDLQSQFPCFFSLFPTNQGLTYTWGGCYSLPGRTEKQQAPDLVGSEFNSPDIQ